MKSLELLKKEFGAIEIISYEHLNQSYEGLLLAVGNNQLKVRSRLAKRTLKKKGYFVAFWEKNDCQRNQPFSEIGSPEILAIVIRDGRKQGVFVFPREVLIAEKILSTEKSTGKMAMRVYPPWCLELNKTATETQKWQGQYFKNYS